MNKKKAIRDFLKTLKAQFQEEQELNIELVTHEHLNIEPLEEMRLECSTVIAEYTNESLNYAIDLKKFFYIGELLHHNIGSHKAEFILTSQLLKMIPVPRSRYYACYHV